MPTPEEEKDLADRKRLFPEVQPEFVSDASLENARRKEGKAPPEKAEELPVATKYAHSKYLLRKAAECGFSQEEAEEMPPQELHEAIRTEALTARREGLREQAVGGSSSGTVTPGVGDPPAAQATKEESILDGVDLNQFDDVTQAILKKLGGSVDTLQKQLKEKDAAIKQVQSVHSEAKAKSEFEWFHGACDKFPQLGDANSRNGLRRNAVFRVLEDLHAAGKQGKSLEDDLAKIVPDLFGAATPAKAKPAVTPTATNRPTQRAGAEELDRAEKAQRSVEEYLAENNISLEDDADGPGPKPKKKFVP